MKRAKLNNDKITALYCRLSKDDGTNNESMSISTQELLCKGWFLPPNTYDCGSFVVNRICGCRKGDKKSVSHNR